MLTRRYHRAFPGQRVRRVRKEMDQADARKEGRGNKVSTNSGRFRDQSCASRSYLLCRLARRMPEILERYERGKFRSIRAAAIAAGIIRERTALELLEDTWKKATLEEKPEFIRQHKD